MVLIVVDKPRKPGRTGRHYLVETEDEKTSTASTTEPFVRLTDAVAAELDALNAEDNAGTGPDYRPASAKW